MSRISRMLPYLLLTLSLLFSSCNLPLATQTSQKTEEELATMVAATVAVLPSTPASTETSTQFPTLPSPAVASPAPSATPANTQATTQAPSPTPTIATVTGKVCYRTSEIPAMTAYFQDQGTQKAFELPIAAGQITYTIGLPPGTYDAFAWLNDYSLGGLYSKAVPCGMKSSCTDHAPIIFTVKAGERLPGVDLCDWFAFSVPPAPGKTKTETSGAISGKLSYPSESIPPLHVVAFNTETSYYYWVATNTNQGSYTITNLPPGTYHVIAYNQAGLPGAYANATNHAPLDVVVMAGQTTSGADISDWYAPAGVFPSDPTKW